jgi:hypothetical protein
LQKKGKQRGRTDSKRRTRANQEEANLVGVSLDGKSLANRENLEQIRKVSLDIILERHFRRLAIFIGVHNIRGCVFMSPYKTGEKKMG